MAFSIAFPDNNRSITRQFIAWGTKDRAAPRPTGVLISTRPNDTPDDKCVVGGTTIKVKKKDGSGALLEDDTRWAIHFRVIGAKKADRFALVILDPDQLVAPYPANWRLGKKTGITLKPSGFSGFWTRPFNTEKLQVLNDTEDSMLAHPEAPQSHVGSGSVPFEAVFPTSADIVPHDNFVAYGVLPTGDYDINTDPASTYVDKQGTRTPVDWSWTDGGGFWAAFFPPINGAVAGDSVDFHVEYKDSGEPETVRDIILS